MGYLRDFIEHVAESFTTLFNLDADPALTEHENVERVIGQTATVAALVSLIQPIPAADFFILTPIQAKMALHIGRIVQERTDARQLPSRRRSSEAIAASLGKEGPQIGGRQPEQAHSVNCLAAVAAEEIDQPMRG